MNILLYFIQIFKSLGTPFGYNTIRRVENYSLINRTFAALFTKKGNG